MIVYPVYVFNDQWPFSLVALAKIKQEIFKAPAGIDDPDKHLQGKETLLHICEESRPCYTPVRKEDLVAHQQEKKTLVSLSGLIKRWDVWLRW